MNERYAQLQEDVERARFREQVTRAAGSISIGLAVGLSSFSIATHKQNAVVYLIDGLNAASGVYLIGEAGSYGRSASSAEGELNNLELSNPGNSAAG